MADGNESKSGSGAQKITLVVRSQDNTELAFNVKADQPFSKVQKAYCKAKGINDIRTIRFLTDDGARLDPNKTILENQVNEEPDDEDGGVMKAFISAVIEQLGGSSSLLKIC